jgi:hypothetical protein
MILAGYSVAMDKTVDEIYDAIKPVGDSPLSISGIQALLASYGVKNEWAGELFPNDLFDTLIDNRSVISLIHYAPLVDAGLTQKKGFRGAHFVVVVGIDITGVSIHDPYTDDESGKSRFIPFSVWLAATAQNHLDGNPNNVGIRMSLPLKDLSIPVPPATGITYAFGTNNGVPVIAVNIRSGPAQSYKLIGVLEKSKNPTIFITKISGEYGLLSTGGWVYMGYFRKI